MDALKIAAGQLLSTKPDFVTVTYGAGGSTRRKTLVLCDILKSMGFAVVMPHLTCVGHTRSELVEIVDEIHRHGFRNIMALRGDPPKGETVYRPPKDGLAHASDLVAFDPITAPGHRLWPWRVTQKTSGSKRRSTKTIKHLRAKIAAGGSFITTQLFFENDHYFDFVDKCRNAGIHQPIIPGLMPALSHKQINRFRIYVRGQRARLPCNSLEKAGDNAEAASAVGIHWAVRQNRRSFETRRSGIHLYILNRAKVALAPALTECFARYRKRWMMGNGG